MNIIHIFYYIILNIIIYYIKYIDLSHNLISVHSSQEERDWETFLQSFRRCRAMRRLVLSSNDFSKAAAFEIFARVYSQHPRIDSISIFQRSRSILDEVDQVSPQVVSAGNSFVDCTTPDSTAMSKIPNFLSGVRSIPYIIFQNVGMTGRCSL